MTMIDKERLRNMLLNSVIPKALYEAVHDNDTDVMKHIATYVAEFISDNFEPKKQTDSHKLSIHEELGILGN